MKKKHETGPHTYFPSKFTWKSPFHKSFKGIRRIKSFVPKTLIGRKIWCSIYVLSIHSKEDVLYYGIMTEAAWECQFLQHQNTGGQTTHRSMRWGRKKRLHASMVLFNTYLQHKIKSWEMCLLFLFPKRVLGDPTEANSHGTKRSELAENDPRTC